jgi:hypothetical protein
MFISHQQYKKNLTYFRLINSSSSSQPPTTFKDPAQFYQEPNCRVNTKRTTSIDNPPHYRNSSEPLCGQYFDDEELPQANNNHRSHNPMLSPHTAPPSPREHGDGLVGDGLRTHSLKSSPSMAQQPKRKYSSDATSSSIASDVAAIASLSLAKNGSGSMAHLLEVLSSK